jgi:hypothetical protein
LVSNRVYQNIALVTSLHELTTRKRLKTRNPDHMSEEISSPLITHLSWGRLGEWDWSETGTDHVPGIQTTDVEELLEHGAKVVVLSRGFYGRLQICSKTLEMLKQRGINFHMLQTEQAVRLYNKLREKKLVAGLFHSTC